MTTQKNIVSNIIGTAKVYDPDLLDPWSLAKDQNDITWVSSFSTSTIRAYWKDGQLVTSVNVISGHPTGIVYNPLKAFTVSKDHVAFPAHLIIVADDGSIQVYQPNVDPVNTIIVVPPTSERYYTSCSILPFSDERGNFYATDVRGAGVIYIFDEIFRQTLAITTIFARYGYRPFNLITRIKEVDSSPVSVLYILYAYFGPDHTNTTVISGVWRGYLTKKIDLTEETLVNRSILNAPYGLAKVDNKIYIGNYGDGAVNVFQFGCDDKVISSEQLRDKDDNIIRNDGLRGLLVNHCSKKITFAAALDDGNNGLVGTLNK